VIRKGEEGWDHTIDVPGVTFCDKIIFCMDDELVKK